MIPPLDKIALAQLEGQTLDWMHSHGDRFPRLRDLLHEVSVEIDATRDYYYERLLND